MTAVRREIRDIGGSLDETEAGLEAGRQRGGEGAGLVGVEGDRVAESRVEVVDLPSRSGITVAGEQDDVVVPHHHVAGRGRPLREERRAPGRVGDEHHCARVPRDGARVGQVPDVFFAIVGAIQGCV